MYSVKELATLAGVSVRTLHHYDELGLVCARREKNGYRSYDSEAVDRLHQVLLFREAGLSLSEIGALLDAPGFDKKRALQDHLQSLKSKRRQIDGMIANVENTLACLEEGIEMSDEKKFEAFKRDVIAKNEVQYGEEARAKYGDEAVDASNANLMGMSEDKWKETEALQEQIREHLLAAMETGDPFCEEAMKAAECHKQWLCAFWKKGTYTPQAHKGLACMYVADDRFKAYYDKWAPGAAEFLRDAIEVYCS